MGVLFLVFTLLVSVFLPFISITVVNSEFIAPFHVSTLSFISVFFFLISTFLFPFLGEFSSWDTRARFFFFYYISNVVSQASLLWSLPTFTSTSQLRVHIEQCLFVWQYSLFNVLFIHLFSSNITSTLLSFWKNAFMIFISHDSVKYTNNRYWHSTYWRCVISRISIDSLTGTLQQSVYHLSWMCHFILKMFLSNALTLVDKPKYFFRIYFTRYYVVPENIEVKATGTITKCDTIDLNYSQTVNA